MKININAHLGFHTDGARISIQCEDSGIEFARIQFNGEETLKLMANYGRVKGEAEVNSLDKVGKYYDSKHFSFELPERLKGNSFRKSKELKEYMKSICPDGWEISTYLGSQSSFKYDGKGNTTVNTYIFRYLDEKPENNEVE